MKKQFISIDWGTTNFRMRLVELSELKIIEEVKSSMGVKALNQIIRENNRSRQEVYFEFIKEQIEKLRYLREDTDQIIISGMASSNIGLKSLPYANLPIKINGAGILSEKIKLPESPFSILLISGVRSDEDVMRGEEIEAIGLAKKITSASKAILVLPGTHSKHLFYENGQFLDFQTFMTGEIFSVLGKHTILAGSIAKTEKGTVDEEAFLSGVSHASQSHFFFNELFKIRAKDILGKDTHEWNYHFLSGLTIGQELQSLIHYTDHQLYLFAEGELANLYMKAARAMGLEIKRIEGNPVVLGQWIIYESQYET